MSTKNLLRQLYSLENVTRQILALSPDVVVFARPDLIYQDSLYASILSALQQHQRPIARVPFWHWASGGYNDRFSICSGWAIQAYGFRAKLINSSLAEKRRSLHSELFFEYALDRSLVFVRRLDISASRIRLEGRVVKEKFSDVSGSRLIRHWIREACKHGIERL